MNIQLHLISLREPGRIYKARAFGIFRILQESLVFLLTRLFWKILFLKASLFRFVGYPKRKGPQARGLWHFANVPL